MRKITRYASAWLALLALSAWPAAAQTTVKTLPSGRVSIDIHGTITTGNTFQSVMAYDSNRSACLIANNSTHTLYVYPGPTASATTSNSIPVAPGGTFSCANPGGTVVVQDNIAVTTSTTSDTFAGFYQD